MIVQSSSFEPAAILTSTMNYTSKLAVWGQGCVGVGGGGCILCVFVCVRLCMYVCVFIHMKI